MAITLADCKSIALGLLNEKGTLHWSDTQQTLFANVANRFVWDLIVGANPDWVRQVSNFSWPADTTKIDMTSASYLGAEPKTIKEIIETESSGSPSASNASWPWTPVQHRLRHRKQSARRSYLRGTDQYYSISGNYIIAEPIPTSIRYVQVEWVPQVTALANATDEVLNGQAEAYGDSVAFYMAHLLNGKDNHNPAIAGLWESQRERIVSMASSRQIQRNNVVGSGGRM